MPNFASNLTKLFQHIADKVSRIVGSPWWFMFSVLLVIAWIFSKPFIESTEIWHLLINTTTTILTFIMMSLLHASQSKWERKMEKIQLKEESIMSKIKEEVELEEKELSEIKKSEPTEQKGDSNKENKKGGDIITSLL